MISPTLLLGGSPGTAAWIMGHYESEARAFPHPRSPEALRAIAHRWGSVVGCAAAEAFELVRAIR
jgi:hypothetical protein